MTEPDPSPVPDLNFTFPHDCICGVGEVFGSIYALPAGSRIHGTPLVLDIGANCGAFTIWARMNWAGCGVICYEPQPDIFAYLKANTEKIPNVTIHNCAVGDTDNPFLLLGKYSRLCAAQSNLGEQSDQAIPITVIPPEALPAADIVKIDAEGAEGYIVEHLPFTPAALMLEWHGADNRRRVELALRDRMKLVSGRILSPDTGIYCYLKP